MGYIYIITNSINTKVYIGKTLNSIHKRWVEHCRDYIRDKYENKPLYRAMRKHGKENFNINELEQVDYLHINEREQFWIKEFNSYKSGYNATKGGDGVRFLDYDAIIDEYKSLQNINSVSRKLHIHKDTIKKVINNSDIIKLTSQETNKIHLSKKVLMFDLDNNYIQSFYSLREAARWIISSKNINITHEGGISNKISLVCRSKRITAYGYKWSFDETIDVESEA